MFGSIGSDGKKASERVTKKFSQYKLADSFFIGMWNNGDELVESYLRQQMKIFQDPSIELTGLASCEHINAGKNKLAVIIYAKDPNFTV